MKPGRTVERERSITEAPDGTRTSLPTAEITPSCIRITTPDCGGPPVPSISLPAFTAIGAVADQAAAHVPSTTAPHRTNLDALSADLTYPPLEILPSRAGSSPTSGRFCHGRPRRASSPDRCGVGRGRLYWSAMRRASFPRHPPASRREELLPDPVPDPTLGPSRLCAGRLARDRLRDPARPRHG